jgi:hypothetical protein
MTQVGGHCAQQHTQHHVVRCKPKLWSGTQSWSTAVDVYNHVETVLYPCRSAYCYHNTGHLQPGVGANQHVAVPPSKRPLVLHAPGLLKPVNDRSNMHSVLQA